MTTCTINDNQVLKILIKNLKNGIDINEKSSAVLFLSKKTKFKNKFKNVHLFVPLYRFSQLNNKNSNKPRKDKSKCREKDYEHQISLCRF
jgi:hypothetical protein